MPTMARKKRNLPKWSGELAEPIDFPSVSGLLKPKPMEELWPEVLEARVAKLPALARALGLPPGPPATAREAWFADIALQLAVLVCPGFQLKLPSSKLFHRKMVGFWFAHIEQLKRDRRVKTDLEGCTESLKLIQPELARPHNKTKLQQQARTFANLIARERTRRKRRAHLG
jgi:hypothetical protein